MFLFKIRFALLVFLDSTCFRSRRFLAFQKRQEAAAVADNFLSGLPVRQSALFASQLCVVGLCWFGGPLSLLMFELILC